MFALDVSGWSIVLRTVIVFVAVLLGLLLTGKRIRGQTTPLDLVVILLISNAVQNAMVGPDTSVTGGLIAAGVLFAGDYAVGRGRERFPLLRRAVEGNPTLLIHDGRFVDDSLRSENLVESDVLREVREHGLASEKEVQTATLEIDGTISVIPKGEQVMKTHRRVRQVRHD